MLSVGFAESVVVEGDIGASYHGSTSILCAEEARLPEVDLQSNLRWYHQGYVLLSIRFA